MSLNVCEICGKPLKKKRYELLGQEFEVLLECECHKERIEQELKNKAIKRIENARRLKMIKCFGFDHNPKKFIEDDELHPEASKAARAFCERFEKIDNGIIFFGETDQGKTFISECIADSLLERGYNVVMRSVPDIVSEAQKNGFEDWISKFMDCDLLILDDLGAERTTEFAQEVVYAVVDGRYRRGKKMIVSTNLSREQLQSPQDIQSKRIYGRILEKCLPIEFIRKRKRSTKDRYDKMRKGMGL